LDKRIRSDHPLRQIQQAVDFTFVRAEVTALYGDNGNESVDPAVILKMMFLLLFDNVASERELMRIIPERLDYLWFLGYELDDPIPITACCSTDRNSLLERSGDGVRASTLRGEPVRCGPYPNPLISLDPSLPANGPRGRRSATVTVSISSPWSSCTKLMGSKSKQKKTSAARIWVDLVGIRGMVAARFHQGGAVIKFRCPRCTQKIAVNDEGVGVDISCPTCTEKIVVPPRSTPEFQPVTENPQSLVPSPTVRFDHDWERRAEEAERRAGNALTTVRAALLPHLARLMMDKLVQTLVLQRRGLMDTQENATQRVEDLEKRLETLQQRLQRQLQTHERRIGELQAELAAKEKENGELAIANMRLARAMELERLREAVEAESRDADLLLHA
jgi:DNA-directed RNA polymerase subunit RPC12/RpoP